MAHWTGMVLAVVVIIGLVWARGSLQSSFKSHFQEQAAAGHGRPEDYTFDAALLGKHAEVIAAAGLGLVLLARQRRWREFAFPAVLLATAAAIHAVHRPWWNYYYLHLAIPLGWIGGLALRDILWAASGLVSKASLRMSSGQTWKGLGLCAVAAVVLARSEKRLVGNLKDLRHRPTVASSAMVAKMKEYAGRTHWAFADPVIYPFHAQVPVPPELAIVMLKRFWSGQLTTEAVVETCKRYRAEQLVLAAPPSAEWKELLSRGYTKACAENGFELYLASGPASPTVDK